MLPRAPLTLLVVLALAGLFPALATAQASERPLVYVFVLDGLDGDRVDSGRAPFIASLLRGEDGARSTYYPESRSVMIAETNPNHVAMATGAYGDKSGIPGNSFAIYSRSSDKDSCSATVAAQGQGTESGSDSDDGQGPNVVSGENANCLQAETLFQAIDRQSNPYQVTTAGIFGKPKLGRIFAGRRPDGRFFADYLFAPCEDSGDKTPYCRQVPINPVTRNALDDGVVMNEVLRTVREGVPADGGMKRPDLTFVNFPQIDAAGHATGAGSLYDEQIALADAEVRRFVNQQKELRLWSRTVMVLVSDHSMDSTPEKTSLDQRFRTAGISSSAYRIVQNGSAALVYLTDRRSPDRFDLLRRLRAASLGVGSPTAQIGAGSGVTEALYREDNPVDGGAEHTLGRVHPAWRLQGPRTGDLVVNHDPGGAFSDPVNPLAGNHGGPQTLDNFLAVTGGSAMIRQGTVAGSSLPGFDDTLLNPDQAENVDIAPTVARLFGRSAPAQSEGRFLSEAFVSGLVPPDGDLQAPVRSIRLTVDPRRARVGRPVRFRFRATALSGDSVDPPLDCNARPSRRERRAEGRACASRHRTVPVRGATVRFAGASGRTDSRGYVTLSRALRRSGLHRARAERSGFRPGSARVRGVRALGLTG